MAKLRVRGTFVFVCPTTGVLVVPKPDDIYNDTDPLVKAYRWAFATDDELWSERHGVEQASAVPGEKRATRRPAK